MVKTGSALKTVREALPTNVNAKMVVLTFDLLLRIEVCPYEIYTRHNQYVSHGTETTSAFICQIWQL